MAREDLVSRAASVLTAVEHRLRRPGRRWVLAGSGIAVVILLHAVTGDPRWAWLSALPAVVTGVLGGGVFGLAAALVAALGHVGVDAALGLRAAEVYGVVVRTGAFAGLGLLGAVLARIEAQRDTAMVRSATEDPVTGLLNVRTFYDGLRDLRRSGHSFSILLADVAGMRRLNDTYGHPLGTEALRALGHALRRSVKQGDLVARLGGDEVAIALVGADDAGARAAAARLAALLAEEELTLPDGTRVEVHVYFGIASFPEHGPDEAGLLRAADHAVIDAKTRGPDEVSTARSPSTDDAA